MSSKDQLSSHNSAADIHDAAREWFVLLLDMPSPSRRAQFEAWLQLDPAHYEAYMAVETAWHVAEKPGQNLAAKESDELAVYLRKMDKSKRERKNFRRLSTLCIFLAVMFSGAIWLERPGLLQDLTSDYVTERGERRTITLSDGSSVLMDADSVINEDYSQNERRVQLVRGGAFFNVEPSQTPFIVEAGSGEIRVLGTGFDVRLIENGGVVTLEHGRVSVSADGNTKTTVLEPGQQVQFDSSGIGVVQSVDIDDALAWRGGRFVFYRSRLVDVVREIERYRKGRILITSSNLADERVTGSFSLSDADAALLSLQASVKFKTNNIAGHLILISP